MLPLLTRYLGKSGYGLYTSIYAFVGTFGILGDIGLNVILNREVARKRERTAHLLGSVLLLKLLLMPLSLGIVALAALPRSFGRLEWTLLAICALESGVRTVANTLIAMLRAHEVMGYETLIAFADRAVWIIGILLVIKFDLRLVAVFLAFLIAALIRLVLALIIGLKFARPFHLGFDWGVWRFMLSEAWPVGLALGIKRMYDRIGVVQLSLVEAPSAVGMFSAPNRIYQLTTAFALSIPTALFPSLSVATAEAGDRARRIFLDGLRVLLLLAVPIAGFYALFAPSFIPWFLGTDFEGAAPVMTILAPALVLAVLNGLLSVSLRAGGRQRFDMLTILAALAVHAGLNFALIPSLGPLGPAVAMLISQGVRAVLAFTAALSLIGLPPFNLLAAPFLGGLGMLIAWALTRSLPAPAGIVAALVVYGVVALAAAHIDPGMATLLRKIWLQRPAFFGKVLDR